jgi:hypothetical protein
LWIDEDEVAGLGVRGRLDRIARALRGRLVRFDVGGKHLAREKDLRDA